MNQKTFAIFIGAIMVLSAFTGMIMLGGDQSQRPIPTASDSLDTFGVQGRLVDRNFESIDDLLQMSPDGTVLAYWLNLSASQNLTDAARAVLPQPFALSYGNSLYPTEIQRAGAAYFNNTWAEFHWIRPFRLSYDGIVVPYEGYMMIPIGSDFLAVMGKPALFGTEPALKEMLNVISGEFPTDEFSLPADETADLQVAALGSAASKGGYQELYLGVVQGDSGYDILAEYLNPDSATAANVAQIASQYGLTKSADGDVTAVSGSVSPENLEGALKGLLPGLAQPF